MTHFVQKNIKKFFPYLNSDQNKALVYFDNAATTHKPKVVIDSILDFYACYNSNIHRSAHKAGSLTTSKYEAARDRVAHFLGAQASSEIIFTSGATESINLVANSFGESCLTSDSIILVSPIEHHSNMLPWVMAAKKFGSTIKPIPLQEDLTINLDKLEKMLNKDVKIIAVHHVSNVTGIAQNIREVSRLAHRFDAAVFVDGAQAPAHLGVDVQDLGCDFYCFSGHKLFGPTGTGVLFAKTDQLETLLPYKTGGQMVAKASFEKQVWSSLPLKFEAGTPNIAGIIGLASAIEFLDNYGIEKIIKLEADLSVYMSSKLAEIPDLISYGNFQKSAPIFAFNIKGLHQYDIATLLSENNILIRGGHLCNQGIMDYFNIDGCLRASLAFYNNLSEVDQFIIALKKVVSFCKKNS